jgi:hypothetical protein
MILRCSDDPLEKVEVPATKTTRRDDTRVLVEALPANGMADADAGGGMAAGIHLEDSVDNAVASWAVLPSSAQCL